MSEQPHWTEANNPFALFDQWLNEASNRPDIKEPTAMTLATVAADGMPSARVVLLKGFDVRGFCFYTNMESRKSRELSDVGKAGLCFYWMPLDRQIRISGAVERVSGAEADAYFATRGRQKQLGAWASKQSEPMAKLSTLSERIEEMSARFPEDPVPRPDHWSGWRVIPQEIEFWQQREFRLHERIRFLKQGNDWQKELLFP